jgi:hypothetical protein
VTDTIERLRALLAAKAAAQAAYDALPHLSGEMAEALCADSVSADHACDAATEAAFPALLDVAEAARRVKGSGPMIGVRLVELEIALRRLDEAGR